MVLRVDKEFNLIIISIEMGNIFEKRPDLEFGVFSPTKEEIAKARKEAESKGEDPDKAEKELHARMANATKRLHSQHGEKTRKELEDLGA